jgi:hypothetical protein
MLLTYPLMTAVQLVSAQIGRVTGNGLAVSGRSCISQPWHYPDLSSEGSNARLASKSTDFQTSRQRCCDAADTIPVATQEKTARAAMKRIMGNSRKSCAEH